MIVTVLVTITEKVRFIEGLYGKGILAGNGKNFDIVCPVCPKKQARQKLKLSIHIETLQFHCWVCGTKGYSLAPLIYRTHGYATYKRYCAKFLEPAQHNIGQRDIQPEELRLPADFQLLVTAPGTDPDVTCLKHYLFEERGLTERDLWYFKLGVSGEPKWKRRVIVPSFDGTGKLNYFVARAIDRRRYPKYDNPEVQKLSIIFNELNVDWTQRLALCEGSFDMFKCGDNTVPLLGSVLDEHYSLFNKILINRTPVTLLLDADVYETKTPVIAKRLAEYDIDVNVADTRLLGDPGASTKQQVKEAFDAARPITWDDTFTNRLRQATRTRLSF